SRPVILGARHFVTFLATLGLVSPTAVVLPSPPEPALLGAFRQWRRMHRGTTAATLHTSRLPRIALLHTLGEQPASFEAQALRIVRLERAGRRGIDQATKIVPAVRMFLRFLSATGQCAPGLEHALPAIGHGRLASLPTERTTATVAHGLSRGDRAPPSGIRAWAVLVLRARLGRRAGDVAALQGDEIHWPDGTRRVAGTNRRATRLPLPPEVGEASLFYCDHQRAARSHPLA